MKILKKKVALANKSDSYQLPEEESDSLPSIKKTIQKNPVIVRQSSEVEIPFRRETLPRSPYTTRCIKNVAKNYGRAICNFILAGLGDPYLEKMTLGHEVTIEGFKNFIKEKKNTLDGIDQFREMLLTKEDDPQEVNQYRIMFQKLGEIFVKYFSVNWIFGGRLNYKQEYLKFRYKVLRRIQNPELFTYIR